MKEISRAIILKSLKKELLPQEQEKLDNWLQASQLHREYYIQIQKSKFNREQSRANYINVIKSLFLKKSIRRVSIISSLSACVLIIIGIFLLRPDKSLNNYQMLAQIAPVEHRAYITDPQSGEKEVLNDGVIDFRSTASKNVNEAVKENVADANNGKQNNSIELKDISISQNISVSMQTIYIPKGGEYSIILSDNSHINVHPNSKLQFANDFSLSKSREIYLEGEAFFQISKDSKPFIVRTKTADIQVYGTSFYVEAYNDNPVITTVSTGKVSVREIKDSKETFIIANQQAILDNGIKIKTVDSSLIEAWNNGLFAFDDAPLEEVAKKLERWYNVEIVFNTPELRQNTITCRISRTHNLSHVFEMINHAVNMNFKIHNNKIILFR